MADQHPDGTTGTASVGNGILNDPLVEKLGKTQLEIAHRCQRELSMLSPAGVRDRGELRLVVA